jgi:elongation factor G
MEEVPKYIFDSKEIDEELELDFIEWDNSLTEKYFKKPSKKILQTGLMEGFLHFKHIPCFAGSALNGLGVKPLLDFLATANLEPSKDEFSGKLIKRITHPDLGKIYLVKSYSELAIRKEYFLNSKKIIFEKFYEISVNEILESDFISANSVFYAKIKNPFSKDLDSANVEYNKNPEKFSSTKFSNNRNAIPIVETYSTSEYFLLLEPESPELREKLIWGLEELVWEDQGLDYTEKDTTQLELRGSGELHLEVAISRLKEFIGEIFQISLFQVAKYELWKKMTLKVSFEHSAYENKLKSGTLNCVLESSSDLSNKVFWDFELDEDLKSSIESAVNEIVSNGNQGFLVQGLQIRFVSYLSEQEKNDSTPSLLKVATISGIKSALKNNTVFIGPKVHFEIIIPESYYGSVLAVLNRRSAKIIKVDVAKGNKSLLKGEASAQKMLGFQSALRNMTQGRGFYSSRVFFDKDTYYEF